jgi:hypothetical protein
VKLLARLRALLPRLELVYVTHAGPPVVRLRWPTKR